MSNVFAYTQVDGVRSSAIALLAYNEDESKLFVRFTNDNERVYSDVPAYEYECLRVGTGYDGSVGRYYNYEVSGQYQSAEVTNTELVAASTVEDNTTAPDALGGRGKYGIRYNVEGTGIIAEFLIQADNPADALRVWTEKTQALADLGMEDFKEFTVKSVTQYFE